MPQHWEGCTLCFGITSSDIYCLHMQADMYFVSSVKIEISTSIVLHHNQADLKIILLCSGIPRFERLLPTTHGKVQGESYACLPAS